MGIEWSENLLHPSVVVASKGEQKQESVTKKDLDTKEKHNLEKEKATKEVVIKNRDMKEQEEKVKEEAGKVVPAEASKAVAVAQSGGASSASSETSAKHSPTAVTGEVTGPREVGGRTEMEGFGASVEPRPKPGTSAEEAARRPDHRAATDAL